MSAIRTVNFEEQNSMGSAGAVVHPELEETPQEKIQNITNEMIKLVPIHGPSDYEKSLKEFLGGSASKSGAGAAHGVHIKKKS